MGCCAADASRWHSRMRAHNVSIGDSGSQSADSAWRFSSMSSCVMLVYCSMMSQDLARRNHCESEVVVVDFGKVDAFHGCNQLFFDGFAYNGVFVELSDGGVVDANILCHLGSVGVRLMRDGGSWMDWNGKCDAVVHFLVFVDLDQ